MNLNEIASRSLGSSNSYAVYTTQYDPSLLNPMPRELARNEHSINFDEFDGVDVWHCWETSFLLSDGFPVSGVTKFVYSAKSPFMVESKSAKLFFNSFDMCTLGDTYGEAVAVFENVVSKHLSECVGVKVDVKFHPMSTIKRTLDIVSEDVGSKPCIVVDYDGVCNHLTDRTVASRFVSFDSLRSRCRHTKQKDTGVALIKTNQPNENIARQIISFREVNEFHEFCCEKLAHQLSQFDDNVIVAFFYNRRGSLDINPIRWSVNEDLPVELLEYIDVNNLIVRGITQ